MISHQDSQRAEATAILARLASLPRPEMPSKADAERLIVLLAEELGQTLGVDVVAPPDDVGIDYGSVTGMAESQSAACGALGIAWRATILVRHGEADEGMLVSALVFLFAGGKRVIAPDAGDYLYAERDPRTGAFPSALWTRDELDEWTSFREL